MGIWTGLFLTLVNLSLAGVYIFSHYRYSRLFKIQQKSIDRDMALFNHKIVRILEDQENYEREKKVIIFQQKEILTRLRNLVVESSDD